MHNSSISSISNISSNQFSNGDCVMNQIFVDIFLKKLELFNEIPDSQKKLPTNEEKLTIEICEDIHNICSRLLDKNEDYYNKLITVRDSNTPTQLLIKKIIKKIKDSWVESIAISKDNEDNWLEKLYGFVTNYNQYKEANAVLEKNCRNNNSISNKDSNKKNETRKKSHSSSNKKHYINQSQSMDSKLDSIILGVINGYEAQKNKDYLASNISMSALSVTDTDKIIQKVKLALKDTAYYKKIFANDVTRKINIIKALVKMHMRNIKGYRKSRRKKKLLDILKEKKRIEKENRRKEKERKNIFKAKKTLPRTPTKFDDIFKARNQLERSPMESEYIFKPRNQLERTPIENNTTKTTRKFSPKNSNKNTKNTKNTKKQTKKKTKKNITNN